MDESTDNKIYKANSEQLDGVRPNESCKEERCTDKESHRSFVSEESVDIVSPASEDFVTSYDETNRPCGSSSVQSRINMQVRPGCSNDHSSSLFGVPSSTPLNLSLVSNPQIDSKPIIAPISLRQRQRRYVQKVIPYIDESTDNNIYNPDTKESISLKTDMKFSIYSTPSTVSSTSYSSSLSCEKEKCIEEISDGSLVSEESFDSMSSASVDFVTYYDGANLPCGSSSVQSMIDMQVLPGCSNDDGTSLFSVPSSTPLDFSAGSNNQTHSTPIIGPSALRQRQTMYVQKECPYIDQSTDNNIYKPDTKELVSLRTHMKFPFYSTASTVSKLHHSTNDSSLSYEKEKWVEDVSDGSLVSEKSSDIVYSESVVFLNTDEEKSQSAGSPSFQSRHNLQMLEQSRTDHATNSFAVSSSTSLDPTLGFNHSTESASIFRPIPLRQNSCSEKAVPYVDGSTDHKICKVNTKNLDSQRIEYESTEMSVPLYYTPSTVSMMSHSTSFSNESYQNEKCVEENSNRCFVSKETVDIATSESADFVIRDNQTSEHGGTSSAQSTMDVQSRPQSSTYHVNSSFSVPKSIPSNPTVIFNEHLKNPRIIRPVPIRLRLPAPSGVSSCHNSNPNYRVMYADMPFSPFMPRPYDLKHTSEHVSTGLLPFTKPTFHMASISHGIREYQSITYLDWPQMPFMSVPNGYEDNSALVSSGLSNLVPSAFPVAGHYHSFEKKNVRMKTDEVHVSSIPRVKRFETTSEVASKDLDANRNIPAVCTRNSLSCATQFHCIICGFRTNRSSHLKYHMRKHTGERPFQCDICPRTFSLKGNAKTHMLTHTGERPYLCEICGMSYKHKCNLQKHYRNRHGEDKT